MNRFVTILTLAVAVLAGGPALRAQDEKQESAREKAAEAMNALNFGEDAQIKGFRVPNYDTNSIMNSQIFGEFARVLPDGNVEITNLKIEFYSYKGEERITDMTITSPLCYFNRPNGVAISDQDVRISRDDLVVTGKGFVFHNAKQELKILSNSRVVVKAASKNKSLGDLTR